MNPHERFGHHVDSRADGRTGEGPIVSHSQREGRSRGKRCGKLFRAAKGTALSRIHQPTARVVPVVALLAHGCPLPAIVAAFGPDARTVARWQAEAGSPCRRVHGHLVPAAGVEWGQVQATPRLGVRALPRIRYWWRIQSG